MVVSVGMELSCTYLGGLQRDIEQRGMLLDNDEFHFAGRIALGKDLIQADSWL